MKIKSSERGIALLVVLMCLSILTFIVLDHLPQASLTLESAQTSAVRPQLERAALNGASLAAKLLSADLDENKYDCFDDRWASPTANQYIFKDSNITITYSIHDESAKWPVNALHKDNAARTETKKIKNLSRRKKQSTHTGKSAIDTRHKEVLLALLRPLENGEDITEGICTALTKTINHRFYRLASLQQVEGVNALYSGVRKKEEPSTETNPEESPWLLPPLASLMSVYATSININTASPEILRALFQEGGRRAVDAIMEKRLETPFESIKDLESIPGVSPDELMRVRPLLGVASSVFRVDVEAKLKNRVLLRSFFLQRKTQECSLLFWADNLDGFDIKDKDGGLNQEEIEE